MVGSRGLASYFVLVVFGEEKKKEKKQTKKHLDDGTHNNEKPHRHSGVPLLLIKLCEKPIQQLMISPLFCRLTIKASLTKGASTKLFQETDCFIFTSIAHV